MQLERIIRQLRAINLSEVVKDIVQSESYVALDLITESQLFERGVDSDGRSLGEYSPFTIERKKEKGHPYDRITLRDEGDFHEGFFASTTEWPGPVVFGSKDEKATMLAEQFGSGIFGLTKASKDEFTEHTKPIIQEEAAKRIREAFQ